MATKTRKIPQEEWDLHKETILSHYLTSDLALDKLVQVMDEVNGFSATKSQFEAQLKTWNARKNLKKGEWEDLLEKMDCLCSQGIQSRVVISGHPVSMGRIQRVKRYCKGESRPTKRRRIQPDLEGTTNSCITSNAWVEIQARNGEWIRYARTVGGEANSNSSQSDSGSTSTVEESEDLVAMVYNESISPPSSTSTPQISPIDISFDNIYSTGVNQHFPSPDMSFIGLEHASSQSFLHDELSASVTFPSLQVAASPLRSFDVTLFQPITFHLENLPFERFERDLVSRGLRLATCPSPMQDSRLLSGAPKLAAMFLQDAVHIMSMANGKPYKRNAYSALITLQKLETILPKTQKNDQNSSIIQSTPGISDVDLHQILLYSAANGFVGIDEIPIGTVFQFLDRNSNVISLLLRVFEENKGPTAKTLAENLFRAAIEACDHQKTKLLLETDLVDVNNTFCFIDGKRLAPIERAAELQALKVVHELLVFKACVQEKASEALVHLINGRCRKDTKREHSSFPEEYQDIVRALIEAGAKLSASMIYSALTRFVDMSLAQMLLDRLDHRVFLEIISTSYPKNLELIAREFSDERATAYIVKWISFCNEVGCIGTCFSRCPPYIVLQALIVGAVRGHVQFVRLLFQYADSPAAVLSAAIRGGNKKLIDFLLSQELDIHRAPCAHITSEDDIRAKLSTTPLAEAIVAKDKVLIKLLENKGALENLYCGNESRFGPAIRSAAQVGDVNYMKTLLSLCPLVTDHDIQVAFKTAIHYQQEEAVRLLLNMGIVRTRFDNSISAEASSIELYKWEHKSVLLNSWLNMPGIFLSSLSLHFSRDSLPEDVDMLKFFCEFGRTTNYFQDCCLSVALKHSNISMVNFLIEKRALENKENVRLSEIIFGFADEGRPDVIRRLLECIPFSTELPSMLRISIDNIIKRSDMERLDIILNSGKFDFKKPQSHHSFLLTAIKRDTDETDFTFQFTNRLLDAGCDINAIVMHELPKEMVLIESPFLAAVRTKNGDLVQTLIDRGANVNKEAVFGLRQTPLQAAAKVGNLDVVELLLRNGADVHAKPAIRCGGTAIQFAAMSGNCNIVMILMEKGADLYGPPSEFGGRWPIEAAAESGRLDMIQFLWNVSMCGFPLEQCRRAVQLAEENGHMGCKELILQLAVSSGIMPTLEG
ncbi:ankyrin [Annulohypoxylon stygium]|nr:ankyrin [Annulohypoxylon stygium]